MSQKERKKYTPDVIDLLQSLKLKLGTNGLHEKLLEIDMATSTSEVEKIKGIVFEEVCRSLNLTVEELESAKKHTRDMRVWRAITFICYILHEKLDLYAQDSLGVCFRMHGSNVSKRISYMNKLDNSHVADKEVVELFGVIVKNLEKKKIKI